MFKLCTAAALGVVLIGSAGSAGVNIEYGQEYEEAYLLACERENSSRACTCSMEALEDRVGFVRFAEEVDRYRDTFLEASPLATLAIDLIARCEAKLHASQ